MLPEPIHPLVLAYTSVILCIGIGALVYHKLRRHPTYYSESRCVEAWEVSTIHFGLFLWIVMSSVILAQCLASTIQHRLPSGDIGWQTVLFGFFTHLSLLTVFLVNHALQTGLNLQNPSPRLLPLTEVVQKALFHFLKIIPLLYLWGLLLLFLQNKGTVPAIEIQPLVLIITETSSPWLLALFGILAVVIAPVTEELLFRGALYRFLKGRLTPRSALVVSALVFSAFHIPTLTYAVPLFLLGLALGHSYETTGNLHVPILFHAIFNLNTFIIILLQRL